MTGIFDGLAGMLSSVFGDVVTHTPDGGSGMPAEIEGVFRAEPVDLPGEDDLGEFRWNGPTLSVTEPAALEIAEGDIIEPGDGKSYRVLPDGRHSGSPASDRFWTFSLELIE